MKKYSDKNTTTKLKDENVCDLLRKETMIFITRLVRQLSSPSCVSARQCGGVWAGNQTISSWTPPPVTSCVQLGAARSRGLAPGGWAGLGWAGLCWAVLGCSWAVVGLKRPQGVPVKYGSDPCPGVTSGAGVTCPRVSLSPVSCNSGHQHYSSHNVS